MGKAFDFVFDGIAAYNAIGFFIGGIIMVLIGAVFCGYWVYWRLCSVRTSGTIKAVYSTGERFSEEQWRERLATQIKVKENKWRGDGKGFFAGLRDQFGEKPVATFFAVLFMIPFMLMPFAFFGFGAWQAYDYMSLRGGGIAAEAKVVDMESHHDSDGGTTYAPVLEYRDMNGVTHRKADKVSTSSKSGYPRGKKVTVLYDRNDPEHFIMDRFWRYMGIAFAFMLVGGGIIGWVGFFSWLRMTGREEEWYARRAARKKNGKVDTIKRQYYASQIYTPIFTFNVPGRGQTAEAAGTENADNWISNKLPGTKVRLMVQEKNGTYKVKRPSLLMPVLGLVFFAPGVLFLSLSASMMKFNLATGLCVLALLGFLAFKAIKIIRPAEERVAMKAKIAEKVTEGFRERAQGFELQPDEIRERVAMLDRNAVWGIAVMLLFGFGLLIGGYKMNMDMSALSGKGVRTEGEIVSMHGRSSSDGDYMYYPVVEFGTSGGATVRFEGKMGSNPPIYKSGDQVGVLYDPDKPNRAVIDHGWLNNLPAGAMMCFGAAMALWALRLLSGIRHRRGRL